MNPCCTWTVDAHGLPAIDLAALPLPSGPGLPADPWHLLGNAGLTAFVHASGGVQLLSGERGWARLNHGRSGVHGWDWRVVANGVTLVDAAATAQLPEAVRFGCGHAQHRWQLEPDLTVERVLSTPPSQHPADRISGLLVTITIHHRGLEPRRLRYHEAVAARYAAANWNNGPAGRVHADYPAVVAVAEGVARARFAAQERRPLTFAAAEDPAQADGHPPSLHLQAEAAVISATEGWLTADWDVEIAAQGSVTLHLLVGYALADLPWALTAARLQAAAADPRCSAAWAATLAGVDDAEMRWHLHQLLAMATWDHRHRSTYIPQGTVYEYDLGVAACARDHIQHALPLARIAPAYVQATLTYLARRTDAYGHLRHTDEGSGLIPLGHDQKSDSELYALLLVAEFLEHGGTLDWSVDGVAMTLVAERWFRQLRDVVSVGPHGLVRLLCSDWNDCFYAFLSEFPYHHIFNRAESHLNTAMAVVILGRVAAVLPGSRLAAAATAYRADLLAALLTELGDRPFLPRARLDDRLIGGDEMFFEPQPWLLAIGDIPLARRRAIWGEIRRRVWDGEAKGARQRERPGHGESGGVWYALNGPLTPALIDVDRNDAREALARLTLARHRQRHPQAWVGAWSGPDCWDPYHGAGDAAAVFADYANDPIRPGGCRSYLDRFPVCCAHAHAWPLHGWLSLRDAGT